MTEPDCSCTLIQLYSFTGMMMKKSILVYGSSLILAVVLVSALVATSNQSEANAASMKKYQFYVTLQSVPVGAEDLIMNATVTQGFGPLGWQVKTVPSPFEGQVVKFVFKVPSGGSEDSFFICGEQATSHINSCEYHQPLPPRGINRVAYTYP